MNSNNKYEDGELLQLLKQKDFHAFTALYDKYAPALYSVVLQIVSEKDIANNVIQEVFIRVWQTIETYQPATERLFTWMLKIARTAALDETRQQHHQKVVGHLPLTKHEMLHLIGRQQTDNCGLKKLIHNLKDEQMMLIDLCYFKDLNRDQVARLLDIPSETVEARLKMALLELRTMFS